MHYSIELLRFYAPTADGEIELHRSYYHRKCRQYKIRHKYDPKQKKVWQKARRIARKKRMM